MAVEAHSVGRRTRLKVFSLYSRPSLSVSLSCWAYYFTSTHQIKIIQENLGPEYIK